MVTLVAFSTTTPGVEPALEPAGLHSTTYFVAPVAVHLIFTLEAVTSLVLTPVTWSQVAVVKLIVSLQSL